MKPTSLITIIIGAAFLGAACNAWNGGVDMNASQSGLQDGFSWVVDNDLAGMPRPGGDPDILFLKSKGIRLLVSLTEQSTSPEYLASAGITLLHLPVVDFQAPTMDQLETFVAASVESIANNRPVGVHCAAGKGRTGTFLAAYFIHSGMTATEAIDHVRSLRPGSIETAAQEAVLVLYAQKLAK